jgi:hypothetical protein
MKKIITTMAAVAALCLPAMAAYDGRVDISSGGGIGTSPGGGGPFTIKIDTGFATSAEMNKVIGMGNPFLSYCLERNENIDLSGNQNYYGIISDSAKAGGLAGGNPDPISKATAYLYSQFRAGAAGFTTAQQKADMQNAVWWLEQEISNGVDTNPLTTGGLTLVNMAKSALGFAQDASTDAAVRALHANGAYGVRVLNLYASYDVTTGVASSVRQDQLVVVPEPSTYVAAALLMIPVISQVRRMRRSA